MKLTVLGSGSKGNCYLLHDDHNCLILEAGVPFAKVLRALRGNIRQVVACLVTHEHQDHAKYVEEYANHGIIVIMTRSTSQTLLGRIRGQVRYNMLRCRTYEISEYEDQLRGINLSSFYVQPFRTVHDAADPCGYYIYHPDTGGIAFATDTSYVPNTFKDVTNLLIECNYDEELLAARTDIPDSLKQRIRQSHMSIDTCTQAIKANNRGTLHQVILIHISEGDGDAQTFGPRVQEATGITTQVATPGAEFDIKSHPF